MATSLIGRCAILKAARIPWKNLIRRQSKNAMYILLPETPPITPVSSPFMRYKELPAYANADPLEVLAVCSKLCHEYELKFHEHMKYLSDYKMAKTFDDVFHPIEEALAPLHYAWNAMRCLHFTKMDVLHRSFYDRIENQCFRITQERFLDETLYGSVKELDANRDNLTDYQKSLLDYYLMRFRVDGITVHGVPRGRMHHCLVQLDKEKSLFMKNVLVTHNSFYHQIWNASVINGIPQHILQMMLPPKVNPKTGPWVVCLNRDVYNGFMQYCHDRELRHKVWHAMFNVAGHEHYSKDLSNSIIIDRIRKNRHELARRFEYKNYAEYAMVSRMVTDPQVLLNLYEEYRLTFLPVASEEIDSLQDFANSTGFNDTLKLWDIPYYRRMQQYELYKVSQDDMSSYFPLPRVLNGVFQLCNQLFGVNFQEKDPRPEVVNDNVVVYDVLDENGGHLCTAYLDLLRRKQKVQDSRCDITRDLCQFTGVKPIVYVLMSIQPSVLKSHPALLSYTEVKALFHQIGQVLMTALSKNPYFEVSGDRKMETDIYLMCGYFLQYWAEVPEILASVSGHHETGEPMSDLAIQKLLKADKHMFGYDMCFELFKNAFELDLHLGDREWWRDRAGRLWEKYMPINNEKTNSFGTSFTPLVVEQLGYYSRLWSQIIAADIFETFIESYAMHDEEQRAALGRRFRETFFGLGGMPTKEVFRRFRGRDHSYECFKHMYGLK